jgi:hypothetical protein
VCVHVDRERQLPDALGVHRVGAHPDPGVGEEQIDGPERLLGGVDQRDVAGFRADVGSDADRPGQLGADRVGAVEVAQDDACALGVEPAGDGAADAAGGPGDDDVTVGELHAAMVRGGGVFHRDESARWFREVMRARTRIPGYRAGR